MFKHFYSAEENYTWKLICFLLFFPGRKAFTVLIVSAFQHKSLPSCCCCLLSLWRQKSWEWTNAGIDLLWPQKWLWLSAVGVEPLSIPLQTWQEFPLKDDSRTFVASVFCFHQSSQKKENPNSQTKQSGGKLLSLLTFRWVNCDSSKAHFQSQNSLMIHRLRWEIILCVLASCDFVHLIIPLIHLMRLQQPFLQRRESRGALCSASIDWTRAASSRSSAASVAVATPESESVHWRRRGHAETYSHELRCTDSCCCSAGRCGVTTEAVAAETKSRTGCSCRVTVQALNHKTSAPLGNDAGAAAVSKRRT